MMHPGVVRFSTEIMSLLARVIVLLPQIAATILQVVPIPRKVRMAAGMAAGAGAMGGTVFLMGKVRPLRYVGPVGAVRKSLDESSNGKLVRRFFNEILNAGNL